MVVHNEMYNPKTGEMEQVNMMEAEYIKGKKHYRGLSLQEEADISDNVINFVLFHKMEIQHLLSNER